MAYNTPSCKVSSATFRLWYIQIAPQIYRIVGENSRDDNHKAALPGISLECAHVQSALHRDFAAMMYFSRPLEIYLNIRHRVLHVGRIWVFQALGVCDKFQFKKIAPKVYDITYMGWKKKVKKQGKDSSWALSMTTEFRFSWTLDLSSKIQIKRMALRDVLPGFLGTVQKSLGSLIMLEKFI